MDSPRDAQLCSVEGQECSSCLSIIYAHHFSVGYMSNYIPLDNVKECEWVDHCQQLYIILRHTSVGLSGSLPVSDYFELPSEQHLSMQYLQLQGVQLFQSEAADDIYSIYPHPRLPLTIFIPPLTEDALTIWSRLPCRTWCCCSTSQTLVLPSPH